MNIVNHVCAFASPAQGVIIAMAVVIMTMGAVLYSSLRKHTFAAGLNIKGDLIIFKVKQLLLHNFCLMAGKTAAFLLAVIMITGISTVSYASEPLDEILSYHVTADVNDDASVNLLYEISWKVLDSDSEGPLSWVSIGIPNSHCLSYAPVSGNISDMSVSDGTYAKIYFDREYFKDEIIDFSYRITMDNMYYYVPDSGVSEYAFTPAWFDSCRVDELVLRWNMDKVQEWQPAGTIEDGYMVWRTALDIGERFGIKAYYPGDAYPFTVYDPEADGDWIYSRHSLPENALHVAMIIVTVIVGILIAALAMVLFTCPLVFIMLVPYYIGRGFISVINNRLNTEISRTVIEYYDTCPNCGGRRAEGKEICSYCATNMVKSRQILDKDRISDEDKNLLKYKKDGTYRLPGNPNRYITVNVIRPPKPASTSKSSSRGGSSSSSRSSCAHSSCACACACACASSGRAGCSAKDFYNTNLKLRNIEPESDE